MSKYRSLESLLQRLAAPLAVGQLKISPLWRNDEQALGLCAPDQPELACYVFTHGQPAGCFGVHLEYPDFDGSASGNLVTACECLTLPNVLDILVVHFGLELNKN